MNLRGSTDRERKTYNLPVSTDIAVLLGTGISTQPRDIVLTTKQGRFKHISELNPHYDCLTYPLFGANLGWELNIPKHERTNKLSIREFYAYRMHERGCDFNIMLYGKRLYHQYIVDQFAKMEQNNIRWVKEHQQKIRADVYQGIADYNIKDSRNPEEIGRRIILPSTYQGSPRHLQQLFQDAMTMTATLGQPGGMVTVTTNPYWDEIQHELKEHETYNDRPDIVARVFHEKLDEILKDITEKQVLGKVVGHLYVIEFQKRGLPHSHIIYILEKEERLSSDPTLIDHIVSAELPDPDTQPKLFAQVTKHNLHGPCRGGDWSHHVPCMQDNHRSKYYPKDFNEDTYIDEDSNYPIYRRRNNGRTFHHQTKQYTFNNCHVVPYNPYLTHRSLGPTSFKDLRSYEDITYDCFKEAANARRLLADDK